MSRRVLQRVSLQQRLDAGWNVFLGDGAAFAEEELFHLIYKKLLGFLGPGLQAVFVQEHFLAFNPLAPGLLADVLIDFLTEIGVEGGLVQAFGGLFGA